jgi:hypothetical protein
MLSTGTVNPKSAIGISSDDQPPAANAGTEAASNVSSGCWSAAVPVGPMATSFTRKIVPTGA